MSNWARTGHIGRYERLATIGPSATSANTKGSWIDISASGVDYDIHALSIIQYSQSYAADFLLDIGIGSTPDVLVNNILVSGGTGEVRAGDEVVLPIFIPKNTQIQCRQQNDYSGTNSESIVVNAFGSAAWNRSSYQRVYTYGAATGDSGGTLVDPGGTANTYGSWVELITSTPQNIKALVMNLGMRGDHLISANMHWHYQIGVGGAGSEQVIVDEFHTGTENEVDSLYPKNTPILPISIPSGTRVAVRCKCTLTSTDRYKDVVLYAYA